MSATTGIALAPSRFRFLARAIRAVIADPDLTASLDDMADRWADAIGAPPRANGCRRRCPTASPTRSPSLVPASNARRPPSARSLGRARVGDHAQGPRPEGDHRSPRGGRHRVRTSRRRWSRGSRARSTRRGSRSRRSTFARCSARSSGRSTPSCSRVRRCRATLPIRLGRTRRHDRDCSTSAARSTTRGTPSSTAPRISPIRADRATRPRSTTSSPRSSRPPAVARSRCSRHGGRCSPRRPSCAAATDAPDPRPGRAARSRSCWPASPPSTPRASSPRWASGKASTYRARACRWSRSTDCRSRVPTTRCCKPAASDAGARRLRGDRPAARRRAPRAGDRPPHPHRHRSWGRGRVRLAPRDRRLPMGSRASTPADATHTSSRRSRNLPALIGVRAWPRTLTACDASAGWWVTIAVLFAAGCSLRRRLGL